ncbi:hypothetical protein ACMD2_01302 [Ananas comosus]|uniref:Uncharacterized protein n=1 Tax=Ananas comosus TaxID=4615 RepID=A0A199VAS5_ANACO|nr:hypothetical protein ACMD2_01302 [Ananas comosus]
MRNRSRFRVRRRKRNCVR